MSDDYRICVRCVMDTSDPEIEFDDAGVCSHCATFDRQARSEWHPGEDGRRLLEPIVAAIKSKGRGREYDCVIGLSGGIDSSYLALIARKELNLRLLAVHVDSGWNSELAVGNIERICRRLGIDLHTHVLNWEEVRDLQLAFLTAGVANLDVPQDHAFTAALYREAANHGIRTLLSGGNVATESVLPRAWGYIAMDRRHLRAIHREYGARPLTTFPTLSFFEYYFYLPGIARIRSVRPLNYVPYQREAAIERLRREVDFRPYETKHGESRFTKFFQNYYLPQRFGFDKRRAHFASLILSGQMKRENALEQLAEPLYTETELREDRRFFVKKLGLSDARLDELMAQPLRDHRAFASNEHLFNAKDRIKRVLTGTLRRVRNERG